MNNNRFYLIMIVFITLLERVTPSQYVLGTFPTALGTTSSRTASFTVNLGAAYCGRYVERIQLKGMVHLDDETVASDWGSHATRIIISLYGTCSFSTLSTNWNLPFADQCNIVLDEIYSQENQFLPSQTQVTSYGFTVDYDIKLNTAVRIACTGASAATGLVFAMSNYYASIATPYRRTLVDVEWIVVLRDL